MDVIKKLFRERREHEAMTTSSTQPPQVNPRLYPDGAPATESNHDFYTRFCIWAEHNDFNTAEFLVPQINLNNALVPFQFERDFATSGKQPPAPADIARLQPWEYQVEWGDVSTLGVRREQEWHFHRHRGSMFPSLAAKLVGDAKSELTVMDVACHCGVMALEFAVQGFKHVLGVDLREENIAQANFLKNAFDIKNVDFTVDNARNLSGYKADIVFCGGLLYHVTFPVELVNDLFNATGKFLIFDSLCQKHPFSGFHLANGRDVNRSLDGDNAVEFIPTYRAMIDLLRSAGFTEIYEILGSEAENVFVYKDRNIRSFLAVKPGAELNL